MARAQSSPGRVDAPSFHDTRYRRFLACAGVSMFGDQFTLVALPLLVMSITSNPTALGLVFAALGLPRAVLLWPAGALIDRIGPRLPWMLGSLASAGVLVALSAASMSGEVSLRVVEVCAALLGAASALTLPASSAMVPSLVARCDRERANGMLLVLRQLAMSLGPVAAGFVIAAIPSTANGLSRGHALAFALDAVAFVLSALGMLGLRGRVMDHGVAPRRSSVPLADGMGLFLRDARLRVYLAYVAAIGLCMSGPVQVALPMLVQGRFVPEAETLGWFYGAQACGTLVGMAAFIARPTLRWGTTGCTLLLLDGAIAVLLSTLGFVATAAQGVALLFAMGLLGGFVQVLAYTWLQRMIPAHLMGRGMSAFMLMFAGLTPVSAAMAGWLVSFGSPSLLLAASGGLLLATVLVFAAAPGLRSLSDE